MLPRLCGADSAKQRAKTADAAVKGRPQADKTSTSSKGAAGKMMSSLQKLTLVHSLNREIC